MFLLLSSMGWTLSNGVRKTETRFEIVALWTSIFFFWEAGLESRFQLSELINMDDLRKLRSSCPSRMSFSSRMIATRDLLMAWSIWLVVECKMASLLWRRWFWVSDVVPTDDRVSRGLKLITVPMIFYKEPSQFLAAECFCKCWERSYQIITDVGAKRSSRISIVALFSPLHENIERTTRKCSDSCFSLNFEQWFVHSLLEKEKKQKRSRNEKKKSQLTVLDEENEKRFTSSENLKGEALQ